MIWHISNSQSTAIGYHRSSTKQQLKKQLETNGCKKKRDAIEQACQSRLYDAFFLYDAGAERGGHADSKKASRILKERTVLQQALDHVCKCRGSLIVWDVWRLARSTVDGKQILQLLKDAGCDAYSIEQQINTVIDGEAAWTQLFQLGEAELRLKSARTKQAAAKKKASGKRWGSIPYGWDLAYDGQSLKLNPDEQETLQMMYDWKQDGHSLRSIARGLNEWLIPAKQGGLWYPETVKNAFKRFTE